MIGHLIHGHGARRVIVLHGWFGDHRIYQPMLAGFDEHAYTFAFIDQRGYGRSRALSGPADIATIASDAAALAAHLGWSRYSVVGHSMGGKAALHLALEWPERVEALIAVTPVWAGAAPFDAETLAMFRAARVDAQARERIIRHSTSDRLPAAWYANLVRDSFATSTPEAFAGYFESWALDDFAARVRGLETPVLAIAGAHDLAITREAIETTWLASLAAAQSALIAQAGHYPMQESPLALAGLVSGFLDSIER